MFFDRDNLIKDEMKLVYETEFSIDSVSKDEIKKKLIKKKVKLIRPANQVNQSNL
jgi:hypothetical protein